MALAALAMVGLALGSIAYGSTSIPFAHVTDALLGVAGFDRPIQTGPVHSIIVDLRLPRVLMAICVGAGLGVVGTLLQTVTRNDLADPFLFGLSSGAAAGAVAVITILGSRFGPWTLPFAAFCGGMLATTIVLLLMRRAEGQGPERLILAGLAVSFLFSGLTNYLVFLGDQRAAHSVLFWMLGGLGLSGWNNIALGFTGLLAIFVFALRYHRQLDAIMAGEQTAESLGVSVEKLRVMTFVAASFATALFVAVTGVIGFVGLMIPHMARPLSGRLHFRLVIAAAMLGAVLLLASDLAARTLLHQQELPVGIITNSLGAAFVIAMLMRRRV
ncbi:iron chelate uptake ABC transporter family permease subunit [Mesorhizobium sp. NBSH29]|uniref:FecCD family ABC transporter permease n=1 Tax=Mesorhizobium sp. NBSH29 TaxID=2654249 RepID=UPI001896A1E6|nr:iron ABC transporter permease [Mesorhizobium sp. NBSH29]QPC88724.1 iron chelate uptake ABC transporter family permease subunit [Mesorhizobium sp. NBSH29]